MRKRRYTAVLAGPKSKASQPELAEDTEAGDTEVEEQHDDTEPLQAVPEISPAKTRSGKTITKTGGYTIISHTSAVIRGLSVISPMHLKEA